MSPVKLSSMLRHLAHLPLAEHGPSAANDDCVDYLFLYRSEKKRRYFTELVTQALGGKKCLIVSYHNLPAITGSPPDRQTLDQLLAYAKQELFSARDRHWMRQWKGPLMALRRAQIQKIYRRLDALLRVHKPRNLVVWNGCKFQDAVLHAVNRGRIPVVYFENGVLPQTTTIDGKGINASGSIPQDPEFYRRQQRQPYTVPAPVDRAPRRGPPAKREEPWRLAQDAFKILVPFQKERDSQILLQSPWLRSMPQLFEVACAASTACQLPRVQLVFREHPSSATSFPHLRKAALERGHTFANGGKLQTLLAQVDAVMTINSSVGLEALLAGKKVITLGQAFYSLDGLVLNAGDDKGLISALDRLPDFSPDTDLSHAFLAYLANYYAVTGDWRRPDAQHWLAVQKRFAELAQTEATGHVQ